MKKHKINVAKDALGFGSVFISLIFVLEVILVFTFIDYGIHSLSEAYSVPDYYFINKIIYGTLIGTIAYLFVRKKPIMTKSLFVSAVVSILLQIRYLLTGYALSFVLLFLVVHFVILFVVSYLGMKLTKM
jgi:hypothetical protein